MPHDLPVDHPAMFFAGCFSWIIVAAWILNMVHRMIMAEVDVILGLPAIGLVLGLGYMSLSPPVPVLQPISIGLLCISGVMIPVMRMVGHQRDKRDVDVEGIEKAYEGFVLRPNNPSAKIRLARHLYTLGIRGHALVLAEDALPNLPRKYFPDEYRMVENWRHYPPPKSDFEPINCVECGHPNPPGNVHCATCGARFLLDRVKGRIVSTETGRKLLVGWFVMALAAIGIPVASEIGGVWGFVLIMAVTVVAAGAIVINFREKEPAA